MLKRFIYLFLSSLIFLSGCNSNDEKEEFVLTLSEVEIEKTSEMLRKLNQDIALGQVFNSQPDETKGLIDSAVSRSIAGMRLLQTSNGDLKRIELAYSELSSALYLIARARLLEINEEETFEVFNQVRLIQSSLAKALGREETSTVLYKYNFGDGIQPDFRALQGEDQFGDIQWATNFQIDLPKAQIQGRNGHAWLVSKSFDLSQVDSPSFRYHSALLVSSRDAELTLFEVVKRVFKTYIILDLKPDEVIEELPNDRKILIKYGPEEVPKARDFHDTWLPERSLEAYKDHKVTIGFLFDTREIEFKQFYSWNIFDFEIRGSGRLSLEPFFLKPFLSENLGGFQSLTQVFAGPEWSSGRDGIYINSDTEGRTNSVLMTPLYVTEEIPFQNSRRLRLLINEDSVVESLDQTKVLISTDYRVGRPFDRLEQNWIELERLNICDRIAYDFVGEDAVARRQSGPICSEQAFDLTDFQDEDFVLAFQFTSEKVGENWDIDSFILEGTGQRLYALPFLSQDNNDLVNVYGRYDFIVDSLRLYDRVYEDDAPEWKKRTAGVNISAHKGGGEQPFSGSARMTGPLIQIDSDGTNVVRIRHTVGFIRGRGPIKVEMRLACDSEEQSLCEPWEEVMFPDSVMNARIDEMTDSNWIEIDDKFLGKVVEFSFYYKSDGDNTPNWTIESFEVAKSED